MGQSNRKKKLVELSENMLSSRSVPKVKQFQLEFLTPEQKQAWEAFQENDILFLLGCAGSGKSFLAVAFALHELLEKTKQKIVLTRPVVEAGENLGFLPGDLSEKLNPYMLPLYDCLEKMCGKEGESNREYANKRVELAPIAYLRGRTLENSVCILDEAQNCSMAQLKLFLTRIGENSKMIITGDPTQSDLGKPSEILNIANKLSDIDGIKTVIFNEETIVRHPLIAKMLKKLN